MLLSTIILVSFLSAVTGSEICFDQLGCFTDAKPWSGTLQRPIGKLPWDPAKIDPRFLLKTRDNMDSPQEISAKDLRTITASNFSTSRNTNIIIHGFTASAESIWVSDMCLGRLLAEDVNCIALDWTKGANTQYSQAANNIRIVGAEIASFIDILQTNLDYSPSKFHLIGHSLGAHAAGEAGKRKPGIMRITGLDPAGPYFQNTPTEVRLDLSDAQLVDVIHTDAGGLIPNLGLGMSQVIGHLDFFPNGGEEMPGCTQSARMPYRDVDEIWNSGKGTSDSLSCNHRKAISYYIQSISDSDMFLSFPCKDWSTYLKGSCTTCPSVGCPKMGQHADTYPGVTPSSQVFYLNTP